jgi:hypothetical protein
MDGVLHYAEPADPTIHEDGRPRSSKSSYDCAAARRLPQVSAELVRLAYPPETPHMMEVHDIDALNVQPHAGACAV